MAIVFPGDGHGCCPDQVCLGEGHHPFAGHGVGEADAVAIGQDQMRMVE